MSIKTSKFTEVDTEGFGTATSTAGAASTATQSSVVTTEALATAAGATYTFTLTNQLINANSVVIAVVGKGTATTGGLTPIFTTPAAGSAVVIFQNVTAAALNGTTKIFFFIHNLCLS